MDKNDAKVTLYLHDKMTKAKQGYILTDNEGEWHFKTCRSRKSKLPVIQLPNFTSIIDNLIDTKQFCQGWITLRKLTINRQFEDPKLYHARRVWLAKSSNTEDLSDNNISKLLNEQNLNNDNDNIKHWLTGIVDQSNNNMTSTIPQFKYKKVDASKLHEKRAPPSLTKHNTLSINDKLMWDQAFIEEYYGLHTQSKTWEYISEVEYKALRPTVGTAFPTYAISIIKKDENGNHIRAKYRIVVLDNLYPHNWSKSECFAPVTSQMELNLLMFLACQLKTKSKQGDFIQAFCQSTLPSHEQHICKSPLGCPVTPPNTYLRLIKTLY